MERRLAELGIDLSRVISGTARGNYVFATKAAPGSRIVHLAGHIPFDEDGQPLKGSIDHVSGTLSNGKRLFSVQEGYGIARTIGLSLLKSLSAELDGNLDRVQRILKINGLVRSLDPHFDEHPSVINGISDLMVEVFGEERGKHARAAYGVFSLPCQVPIEIDMIVEVKG